MEIEDLFNFSNFNADASIPVFIYPRDEMKQLPKSAEEREKLTLNLERLRFVDTTGNVWQTCFLVNDTKKYANTNTTRYTFSGTMNEDGIELIYLVYLQGQYKNIYRPHPLDPPVEILPPYDKMVTRENYVLNNSGIYVFPFDQSTHKDVVISFFEGLRGYLQTLSTIEIVGQVEKWINRTTSLRKAWDYRGSTVPLSPTREHTFQPDLALARILRTELPVDAVYATHLPDLEKRRDFYGWNRRNILDRNTIREINRLFQFMEQGRPVVGGILNATQVRVVPIKDHTGKMVGEEHLTRIPNPN